MKKFKFLQSTLVVALVFTLGMVLVACGGAKTYKVNLNFGAGGAVEVKIGDTAVEDGKEYKKNSVLSVTVTPEETHEIKSVKAGTTVLTATEGVYKHTLTGAVTINVEFQLKEEPTPPEEPTPNEQTPAYIGTYVVCDVDMEMDLSYQVTDWTIKIDETERTVTMFSITDGVSETVEYDYDPGEDENTFIVGESYSNSVLSWSIDMTIVRSDSDNKLSIDYVTSFTEEGATLTSSMLIEMLYNETDELYKAESACTQVVFKFSVELKENSVAESVIDSLGVPVSGTQGRYTVDGDEIRIYFTYEEGEEELALLGVIVAGGIEVDLTADENALFIQDLQEMGIELGDSTTYLIEKIVD